MTTLTTKSGKNNKLALKKELLKLDLGCGQNKQVGFTGVDIKKIKGVDVVHDLFKFPWPFKDESISEIFCSHFFEHVPARLRALMMDEIYRILVSPHEDGSGNNVHGRCTFITPYYSSMRAIQDYTHEWPPICEGSFLYFNKSWREQNKLDHYDIHCDFDFSYGYVINQPFIQKHEEARAFAVTHYINSISDIQVVLTKRG